MSASYLLFHRIPTEAALPAKMDNCSRRTDCFLKPAPQPATAADIGKRGTHLPPDRKHLPKSTVSSQRPELQGKRKDPKISELRKDLSSLFLGVQCCGMGPSPTPSIPVIPGPLLYAELCWHLCKHEQLPAPVHIPKPCLGSGSL